MILITWSSAVSLNTVNAPYTRWSADLVKPGIVREINNAWKYVREFHENGKNKEKVRELGSYRMNVAGTSFNTVSVLFSYFRKANDSSTLSHIS